MFFTIGLVVGFVGGWFINEKLEDLVEMTSKLMFWRK